MLRLTGGIFRGRRIETLKENETRPTQAKLRQALFNSIQYKVSESKVLDIFAGSGALGFEALSRGARHITFIESSKHAIKIIQKNIKILEIQTQTSLISEPFEGALKRTLLLAPFDIILADPPYEKNFEIKLLQQWPWSTLLTKEGLVCIESKKQKDQSLPPEPHALIKIREKNYGDTLLTTYKKVDNSPPSHL